MEKLIKTNLSKLIFYKCTFNLVSYGNEAHMITCLSPLIILNLLAKVKQTWQKIIQRTLQKAAERHLSNPPDVKRDKRNKIYFFFPYLKYLKSEQTLGTRASMLFGAYLCVWETRTHIREKWECVSEREY